MKKKTIIIFTIIIILICTLACLITILLATNVIDNNLFSKYIDYRANTFSIDEDPEYWFYLNSISLLNESTKSFEDFSYSVFEYDLDSNLINDETWKQNTYDSIQNVINALTKLQSLKPIPQQYAYDEENLDNLINELSHLKNNLIDFYDNENNYDEILLSIDSIKNIFSKVILSFKPN